MSETDQLSSLVGDIYDAALDPSRWVGVLRTARAFIGGSAAALFSKDAARKTLNVHWDDGGLDPHYTQLYFATYGKLDPATTGHVLAEVGEPLGTADILPFNEFRATRFYEEWARPQGLVDFASAVIEKSATGAVLFGVFRHERDGIVDDTTRRRMRLIVPHIRRAVLIGRAIDLKAAEAATLADTLDGLSAGMFLVDATGRIVHANASGHAMLAERAVLRAAGGRLIANDGDANRALAESFVTAGRSDATIGTRGICVALSTQDGERYVAHVLPLTSGARRSAGMRYAAAAALFVRKAALDAPSPPEAMAAAFKLTPSELRVLLAIVQLGGVPETAEALGVAETTVKTHLQRLFAKTGSARQAELVKLVAGFATPLAGPPSARVRQRPPCRDRSAA